MTAQPSSQAEREDVAREVLVENLDQWARPTAERALARPSAYGLSVDDMHVTVGAALRAMLAFSDREHATPRSMPEEVAADLLDQYADFIRRDVKADDLERHPYLPLIEQTVTDLRALIPGASA